jgi:hypothetical protein
MKKIFFLLSALFILASCNKWKGEKYSDLTYYSVDFKEKDMTILGFNSNDIDALWFEFSSKDKSKEYSDYTLIAKSNGVFNKETGTCEIDWKNQITFHPSSGDSYVGKWLYEKEKFIVSYDLDTRIEELIFIYKEVKKYKKGK